MFDIDTSFYVVRPNNQLLELLANYPDDSLLLSQPFIWTKPEGGRSWLNDEDHLKLVKLVFLANLRVKKDKNTNPRMKALVDMLFGIPPYSVDIFDQWWHIEKLWYDGGWLPKAQAIPIDILQSFTSANEPHIQNWIDKMISLKQKENTSGDN